MTDLNDEYLKVKEFFDPLVLMNLSNSLRKTRSKVIRISSL